MTSFANGTQQHHAKAGYPYQQAEAKIALQESDETGLFIDFRAVFSKIAA